jgi:hypothetical protein
MALSAIHTAATEVGVGKRSTIFYLLLLTFIQAGYIILLLYDEVGFTLTLLKDVGLGRYVNTIWILTLYYILQARQDWYANTTTLKRLKRF